MDKRAPSCRRPIPSRLAATRGTGGPRRKVADGIDPKETSVEAVARIITGMTVDGRSVA